MEGIDSKKDSITSGQQDEDIFTTYESYPSVCLLSQHSHDMFQSLSTQIRRPYSASISSLPAQHELAGSEVHPELIAFFTCLRNHVTFFVHLIGAHSRLHGRHRPYTHLSRPLPLFLRRGLGTRLTPDYFLNKAHLVKIILLTCSSRH